MVLRQRQAGQLRQRMEALGGRTILGCRLSTAQALPSSRFAWELQRAVLTSALCNEAHAANEPLSKG